MKPLFITLALATAVATTAKAEIYRPSVVRDTTVVGAVAGALIGGHNGDRWAQGAVIGAAAGAVVGAIVDTTRPAPVPYQRIEPVAVVPYAPTVETVVVSAPPRVVYVNPAPTRVVYVSSARPVVVARPVIVIDGGRRFDHRHYRYHHHH